MTPPTRAEIVQTIPNEALSRWYKEDSVYWPSTKMYEYSNLWLQNLAWVDWT